jgi:T4-like virus tail tube protein gp19
VSQRPPARAAMPSPRQQQPCGSFNFRVEIGSGRSALRGGFMAVEFPAFVVPGAAVAATASGADPVPPLLVLRRAFSGALDLYAWWDTARRAKRVPGKVVTVELLDAPGGEPVLTWRFSGCKPVTLQHSPLDAQRSALLIESLSLSFEDVELA